MKNLMIAAVVALLGAGAFADTFYVDPTGGMVSSDDYDGSAETWQGGVAGPKKTLAAAAAEAAKVATKSNPCTIIALPGEYKEGVSNPEAKDTAATLNRVTVPANVTLQSRDGAEKTFIVGAASDAPNANAKGIGTNAVRCASFGTGAKIVGFTLTAGRTFTGGAGGGVSGGTLVDCIVSNNYCGARGGGANDTAAYRCRFYTNNAGDSIGNLMNNGTAYNTLFCGASGETYGTTAYQCTYLSGCYPRNAHFYDCVVLYTGTMHGNPNLHRCYVCKGATTGGTVDPDCVFTNAAALAVGADGKLGKGSVAIDAGRDDYLAKVTEGYRDVDLNKGQRVYNGAVDVGCCEYDPRGDYTDVLCAQDGAMEVSAATPMVIGAENSVSVGTNQTLAVTLLKNGDAATTAWAFYATVAGTGTLELYFGDEATPSQTVTAADGKKRIDHSAADSTALRLVYAGEDGAATVSQFCNRSEVTIEAASAGVAITGDITDAGTYVVPAGVTRTFKIARSNETTKFVSGIEVNGEFFNFYDYPNGKEFAIDGDDVLSSVSIKVIYDDDAKELFVDRVNGSDLNCGLYTNLAFQSLAKAASVATANWTILVQPGVYDNEVSNPEAIGTAKTLNRVTVPANVTLKALGTAEETFIMGAKSDAPNADSYGCGTNAVRCVLMNSGSRTWGFTLTGGRTFTGVGGGGASSGTLVGCIVSNNVCSGKGGGANDTDAYRCRFYWNECGSGQTGPGMFSGHAYGCYFKDCNTYQAYTYQCTFDSGAWARAYNHYNDLYLYDGGKYLNGPKFYHCYFTYKPNTYSTPVLDDECVITNAAALPVDARGCPTAGSLAIDAGRTDYLEKIPEAYRDIDAFGGQRVYNGAVDVGCGEYDWRGDFAATLAKKGVEVDAATANVTTNLAAGLDVPAGESLKLKLVLKTDGKVSLKIVAEDGAEATVTAGGEPVTPGEDGKVEFEASAGETDVAIAVTGEGVATVSDVVLPRRGSLLLVR